MAGRKRKAGKRTASGRLSRAAVDCFDRGTAQAQAMQVLYGTDGADAIGRAYRMGLLGQGNEAKTLLDTARKVANLYWRAYSTGSYKCPLSDRSGGSVVELDHERIKRGEEWLRETLQIARGMGHNVSSSFDQLVIDVHPDSGPAWLDRLCYAVRCGVPSLADKKRLREALDALEAISR